MPRWTRALSIDLTIFGAAVEAHGGSLSASPNVGRVRRFSSLCPRPGKRRCDAAASGDRSRSELEFRYRHRA